MADAAALLAALVLDGPRVAPDGQPLGRRHCVYCGRAAMRSACFIHADLLAVDPHYRAAREGAVRSKP